MWRAVLIPNGDGGQQPPDTVDVILTFDHRITDGAGGVRAVLDLVRLLDGQHLEPEPTPPAQEQLLHDRSQGVSDAPSPPAPGDPRLSVPGALRPFDAVRPEVASRVLDRQATGALVAAARRHGTTVQGALCAAASRVLATAGRDYIRVNTPIDLRRNLGLTDAVALRLMPSLAGAPAQETEDFWALAKTTTDKLHTLRSLPTVLAASGAMESTVPVDADSADAWMPAVSSLDAMVTNLGVIAPPVISTVRLVDIYGPTMSIRMAGEQIIGVATFARSLRMVNVAYDPVPDLLDRMTDNLLEASRTTAGKAEADVSNLRLT